MREGGFTLVELLVALLIFGMISAAGVALLSFSVRSQEAASERLGEVAALRRADSLLAADLAQAAGRQTRDTTGRTHSAFMGGSGEGGAPSLTFVRRGWANPDGKPRASLQKVEYGLVEGRLERRAYRYLDGAEPEPPLVLLRNVEALRLRYRDRRGAWVETWDGRQGAALPIAVEMVLDLGSDGILRQLFLTGAEA